MSVQGMDLDPTVLERMRSLAREGASATELVRALCSWLSLGGGERMLIMVYFHQAFSLSIPDVMPLGGWDFFPQANWPASEIDAHFAPILRKWAAPTD